MKHLVVLCPAYGGAGSVANVAQHQAAMLCEHFLVTVISDSLPARRQARVTYMQVSPPRFDWLRRFCHVPNELALVRAVRNRLFSLQHTVPICAVVCHSHALARLAAFPLQRKSGVPYALVTHGDIFDRPKGTYDARLTLFYKAVTPGAYRHARWVIALSPHMQQCAVRGGADPRTVQVIPNGIALEDIGLDGPKPVSTEPVAQSTGLSAIRLLYAGRLAPEKGVEHLLQACRLMADRGLPFQLRLVGTGPLAENYRRLAETLRLQVQVEFVGAVPRQRLGSLYREADIICVPSISDPLPTVVLEAMAAGCTIVGTNVGGIPFMIEDGLTGAIVSPGDATAMADKIAQLAENRHALADIGRQAALVAAQRFSWPTVGRQLVSLFENAKA
jgi:glycosyltransferase involved in cell wall biosynthesis